MDTYAVIGAGCAGETRLVRSSTRHGRLKYVVQKRGRDDEGLPRDRSVAASRHALSDEEALRLANSGEQRRCARGDCATSFMARRGETAKFCPSCRKENKRRRRNRQGSKQGGRNS